MIFLLFLDGVLCKNGLGHVLYLSKSIFHTFTEVNKCQKLEDAGAGYRTLAENLFAFRENQCTDLPSFAEEHCNVNEIQQLLVQNGACWHKSCCLKYNRNMLKRFLNRKQALENEPEEKKNENSQDQKEILAITVRNVYSVKRRVKKNSMKQVRLGLIDV